MQEQGAMPYSNYHSPSSFEAIYSALYFLSIIILWLDLWYQTTLSNWPALFIGILFASQMLHMYSVLHDLDEQANETTHFLAYLEGGWLILERVMRLIIATTVIFLATFSQDGMVDFALKASSALYEWLLIKGQGELVPFVQIEPRLVGPGTTSALGLALFMMLIYVLFVL